MKALVRLVRYLELVKFSHTLFALPFGLIAMLVAANGLPTVWQLLWLVAAMVCARTAAMTFNRILDRDLDAQNPRTAGRHLPAGLIGLGEAYALLAVAVAGFFAAAYALSWLCLLLAPLVLAILLGYSFTKRFTALSHFVLGLALACAPMGVYVALTGTLPWPAVLLGMAVMLWVAGFDIIYACQDEEFDRRAQLHSVVVRLGRAKALRMARALHVLTVGCLASYGYTEKLGTWYALGVVVVAGALSYEHSLVSPRDISRVNTAFFTVNGFVGLALLLFTALAVFLKPA